MGRIPSQSTLEKMGIDLDLILCPRYGDSVETVDHTLVGCREVKKIWHRTGTWWGRNMDDVETIQTLLQENQTSREVNRKRHLWEALCWSFCYLIWSHMNKIVFEGDKRGIEDMFF